MQKNTKKGMDGPPVLWWAYFLSLNGILVHFPLFIGERMYYNYVKYSHMKFLFDDRGKRLSCLR